jgi:hypothetical protein
VAFGTVITPSLVFLVTSTVMSEAVFLFVELAAVLAIERASRAANRGGRWAVVAGGLAAGAMLVRTAGVALIAAGVLYLARGRRWRQTLIFAVASVTCVLPWSLYARTHAGTRAALVDHGGVMAVDYTSWFWTSEAGTVSARQVGLGTLPARIERNVTNITVRDIGGIFMPLLFRTSSESGLEVIGLGPPEGGKVPSMGSAVGTQIISSLLTALIVVGFVAACRRGLTVAEPLVALSMTMIVLWPFWTFRFVLALTPFLFGYLVLGVEGVAGLLAHGRERTTSRSSSAVRVFLAVVIGLNLLDHGQYIAKAYGESRGAPWKAHADDIAQVLDWIQQHADANSVIAADNPALVYLRTGHPTVAINSYGDRWDRWRRMGVRYLVSLSDGELVEDPRAVLRFKLPDKNMWVIELRPIG